MASSEMIQRAVNQMCRGIEPEETPDALIRRINTAVQRPYRLIVTQEDICRVHGLVDADGERIADDVVNWITANFEGSVAGFANRFADSGYRVTYSIGRIHHLTAADGRDPLAFVQLQIDETGESAVRPLIDPDHRPETMQEIITTLNKPMTGGDVITPARYNCTEAMRFTDMEAELTSAQTGSPPFGRFVADWRSSSASEQTIFRHQWVLMIRKGTDGSGRTNHSIQPFSRHHDIARTANWGEGGRTLQELDQRCGYPMAWFFLSVCQYHLSGDVMASYAGGLEMEARDRAVLRGWLDNPYWM